MILTYEESKRIYREEPCKGNMKKCVASHYHIVLSHDLNASGKSWN